MYMLYAFSISCMICFKYRLFDKMVHVSFQLSIYSIFMFDMAYIGRFHHFGFQCCLSVYIFKIEHYDADT